MKPSVKKSDHKEASAPGDWHALGARVEEFRRKAAWRPDYASFDEWLRSLAQKSGHSAHSLRRFGAVVRFLRRLEQEARITKEEATAARQAPVASLEALKQSERYSGRMVDDLLRDVLSGKKTYREIINITKGTRIVLGQASGKEFSAWCAEKIPEHASVFCPPESEVVAIKASPRELQRAAADFLLVTRSAANPESISTIGFQFRMKYRFLTTAELDRLAGELAYQATFFAWFWLILPSKVPDVKQLMDILKEIDCNNVGIADAEFFPPPEKPRRKPFKVLRHPTGLPLPDRRDILDKQVRAMELTSTK